MWTVFLGATPAILNVVMAYLIRSEEATLHASIGTMSGCLLNIVLDPIFILIFKMGAQGAALATMLSNMFALMYFFGYLLIQKNKTVVCISIRQLSFRKDIVMGICAVGIPASIQNLLNVVSQMVLNNLAALYGTAAVAAMGIAAKVSLIPCQIAMGISQGVMPLIGYAFASKNVERMKGVLRFTMLVAMSLLVIMTIGYELFPTRSFPRLSTMSKRSSTERSFCVLLLCRSRFWCWISLVWAFFKRSETGRFPCSWLWREKRCSRSL